MLELHGDDNSVLDGGELRRTDLMSALFGCFRNALKGGVRMRHIALEEAFSVPEWNAEPDWGDFPIDRELVASWVRKLRDVTEYRLPEMDEYGIDIQVLSLTVPGIQVDQDASTARDNA